MSGEPIQQGLVPPEADQDSRWWWEALAAGRLELPRCSTSQRTFFPPQSTCPHCGSAEWERIEASGRGRLYSWVVAYKPFDMRFAEDVPYTIVAVELNEGVRLLGRCRGDVAELQPGVPMQAFIYQVDGQALLGFEPAS
jgi:uncharacterized OB-fold protein